MKTFEFRLKHDSGSVSIRIRADNYYGAKQMILEAEKAPESAIQSWRVVATKRQIKRTQNLMRAL